ncbi:MAG: hypothetical protein K0S70_3802, partial [Microbacterium sp.]|nr:hypothetical protein [Microbacterium sp.]
VRDLIPDATESARIPVDVADAAEHALALEPIGLAVARAVESAEVRGTLRPGAVGEVDEGCQALESVVPLAVEADEELVQTGQMQFSMSEELAIGARRRGQVSENARYVMGAGAELGHGDSLTHS